MPGLIDIDHLTYSYTLPSGETTAALRGVSLRIQEGEYVALVGANGSGKTTLARHLNALLLPTGGVVRVMGLDTREPAYHGRIRVAVGLVMQAPEDQIVATSILEDVAFGLENQGVPPAEIRARVEAALVQVGMWEHRERPPYLLSAGQMQRVALAGVLALRPRCILFDEATAMLDPAGRKGVLAMMEDLHRQGITVITITHYMEEAARAGRIIVLHRGEVALDGSPAEIFSGGVDLERFSLSSPRAALLARRIRDLAVPGLALDQSIFTPPALVAALAQSRPPNGMAHRAGGEQTALPARPALIEAQGLGHIYLKGTPLAQRALEDANLRVAEGGAHAVLGATGSGKSTLLQHLNGLLRPQEGTLRVGEADLNNPRLDVRSLRQRVGLVFQIPENQFFEQYVGDEIAFGPRMLGEGRPVREAVRAAMDLVGLDFEGFKDRLTFTLSGGERRKVALASVLAIGPRVLLLDEPTAGMDPRSRVELLGRLRQLRQSGITLVLSSHSMEDVVALADWVTVFRKGRDVLDGSLADVFSQIDALREVGLDAPAAAQAAHALRQAGWGIPPQVVRDDELVTALGAYRETARE